jgi:hypothetical protein
MLNTIIACHNCRNFIKDNLTNFLDKSQNISPRVVLVENGSSDGTFDYLKNELIPILKEKYPLVHFVLDQSETGLSQAIIKGISNCTEKFTFITTDDFPFGTTDIEYFQKYFMYSNLKHSVYLGSKAAKGSTINRQVFRRVSSLLYRFLRFTILKSRIKDTQGSIITETILLRKFITRLEPKRYEFNTSFIYFCELHKLPVYEMPVHMPKESFQPSTLTLHAALSLVCNVFILRFKKNLLSKNISNLEYL